MSVVGSWGGVLARLAVSVNILYQGWPWQLMQVSK